MEQSLTRTSDNASVTLGEVEIRPNPNLWLAVFDPVSGLEQALGSNYSSLNPIDANGLTSVDLDLNLRQSLNGTQIYYYSACKSTMYRYQKLIQIYRSIYLNHSVSELSMRHQHERHQPMYYNAIRTVHELDSNNHDAEASHDLDSAYPTHLIIAYDVPLTLNM